MRAMLLGVLLLACSPELDVPDASSEEPPPAAAGTAGLPAAGSGGMSAGAAGEETETGGTPTMGGAGGMAGSVATPAAGRSGAPGVAGSGGGAAVCCSGHYNGLGQCIDDGTVCAGSGGGGSGSVCNCGKWRCCASFGSHGECLVEDFPEGCDFDANASGCVLTTPSC